MKFLVPVLILLLASPVVALDTVGYDTVTLSKSKDPPQPFCPVSKISDNNRCMDCHCLVPGEDGKPKFGIKELKIDAGYEDKPIRLDIVMQDGKKELYLHVDGTNSSYFRDASEYIYRHPEFKKLIVELYTPGGSVMDAWRAVGIIQEMQSRGILVETRVYGVAASAGVILMVAGDLGSRFVNRHAEVMMHKVWTFSMFDLKDPDTAEDQAATLKHFQTNINEWIISRSKLTKAKIEECIYKRNYWFNGEEAVELGLADGFIK